jgi:hypothetical protein
VWQTPHTGKEYIFGVSSERVISEDKIRENKETEMWKACALPHKLAFELPGKREQNISFIFIYSCHRLGNSKQMEQSPLVVAAHELELLHTV